MNTRTIERPVTISRRAALDLQIMLAHRVAQCGAQLKDSDPSGYWQDEMTRADALLRALREALEK